MRLAVHTALAPQPLLPCRYEFPHPRRGDDRGLVGAGGDFEPSTIIGAYTAGAFPWPTAGEQFLWFSPDPRCIIELDGLHVSRRLARTIRSGRFYATVDLAFPKVMSLCAVRPGEGTWITPDLFRAYVRLHQLGWAHSIEVWTGDGVLAGGLYGVGVGAMFGAESMFHRVTDASKVAMVALMQHARAIGIELVDIQVATPHTLSMGATEIPRTTYYRRLAHALAAPPARWYEPEAKP
ncbi:MAG: leucyl/phenylalanyl-tRNA--protein transferase [Dehalococcoidia bacterium]|nr:leucyl/phenylalanyl-tRNA--protein transferase [Dehalococcoidia bacterium]